MKIHAPGTDVLISRLGFGCARLGGGAELRVSARLLESALRHGVTHFDTAPFYGSEDVLGEVIGGSGDITIATKVGLPRPELVPGRGPSVRALYRWTFRPLLGRLPRLKSLLLGAAARAKSKAPAAVAPSRRVLIRDGIHRELDESLRRLRRSCIDLYLIHEPEQILMSAEVCETFALLQATGVIRAYGLGYGGTLPSESMAFGSVDQYQYLKESADRQSVGRLSIFHGVLRHSLHDPHVNPLRNKAKDVIEEVLHNHRSSTVIFSASSPRQISQICLAVP